MLNTAFKRFKEIADKKKQVTAMDLEALVTDELREEIPAYALEWFEVEASSRRPPHATVGVTLPDGSEATGSFTGDGPVDAVFHAINAATEQDAKLREFRVDAVTGGQDALGETSVVLELGGVTGAGQGVSTDIIEAAGRAYVRALSNAVRRRSVADQAADLTAEAAEQVAHLDAVGGAQRCASERASLAEAGDARVLGRVGRLGHDDGDVRAAPLQRERLQPDRGAPSRRARRGGARGAPSGPPIGARHSTCVSRPAGAASMFVGLQTAPSTYSSSPIRTGR